VNFDDEIIAQPKGKVVDAFLISAYLKIFMNYIQIISILNDLELNWGKTLNNFFSFQKTLSGSVLKVISFDCLIRSIKL